MSESRLFSRRLLASSHFSWLLLLIVIATFCRCSLATSTERKVLETSDAEFLNKPFKDIKPKLDKRIEFLDDEIVKRFERLELATLKAHQEQEFGDLLKYVVGKSSDEDALIKREDSSDEDALKKKYGHAVMAVFEHLKKAQEEQAKREDSSDKDRKEVQQAKQALSYVKAIYGASTITATMKIKIANNTTVGQYLDALKSEISKESEKLKESFRNTSELNNHLKKLKGDLEKIKGDLEKQIPKLKKQIKQQNQAKPRFKSIKQKNQSIKQLENLLSYKKKTFQNLKPLKEATEKAAETVSELNDKERREKRLRNKELNANERRAKGLSEKADMTYEDLDEIQETAKRIKNKMIGAAKRIKNNMIGAAIGAKNKIKGAAIGVKNKIEGALESTINAVSAYGRNFKPTVAPAKETAAAK